MNQEAIVKRISWMLILVGPAVSLAVSPSTNYDPINLIKILILSTISFLVLGLIFSNFLIFKLKIPRIFILFILFFVIFLTIPLFLSGAPVSQQFWGSFGRNTGYLTYISLLFILIGTMVVQRISFYKNLVNCLVFTSVPVTLYCLIQIAGLDPIAWSSMDTFATFGNTNFLSAFLGISSLASIILIFNNEILMSWRLLLVVLALVDSVIILDTGSIQGFMILVAGLGIFGFLYLRSLSNSILLKIPYIAISLLGLVLVCMGVANKGPFAKFIFQPSILFRADYWHAGWAMTLKSPIFGIGLDSYGDWYRELRGSISALRTGPNRTANTAHNIFLDLSSNGGFPLLIAYLALLAYALILAIKKLKGNREFDAYFVAIFSCWVAYQIQALVSINQIAVGVWGWLLNGALIGYSLIRFESAPTEAATRPSKKKKNMKKQIPASAALISFLFGVLGCVLAFLPFNADAKYKSAVMSGDLNKMIQSVKLPGSTAWHISQVINTSITNNYFEQATLLDQQLINQYPKDFFGWSVLYYLKTSTPAEKSLAVEKLHGLDPFNPELPKS